MIICAYLDLLTNALQDDKLNYLNLWALKYIFYISFSIIS